MTEVITAHARDAYTPALSASVTHRQSTPWVAQQKAVQTVQRNHILTTVYLIVMTIRNIILW